MREWIICSLSVYNRSYRHRRGRSPVGSPFGTEPQRVSVQLQIPCALVLSADDIVVLCHCSWYRTILYPAALPLWLLIIALFKIYPFFSIFLRIFSFASPLCSFSLYFLNLIIWFRFVSFRFCSCPFLSLRFATCQYVVVNSNSPYTTLVALDMCSQT